jgi:hypothetical protein
MSSKRVYRTQPEKGGARAGADMQTDVNALTMPKTKPGLLEKRFGGLGEDDPELQTRIYVPTNPKIGMRTQVERDCGNQERVLQGPVSWQSVCDRTTEAGIQECRLEPISSRVHQIIPTKCTEDQFNVLKGVQMQTVPTLDQNGNPVSVQTTATPIVDRYRQIRSVRPSGVPIEYERLPRVGDLPEPQIQIGAAQSYPIAFGRELGGGSASMDKKIAGANVTQQKSQPVAKPKTGGIVPMPDHASSMNVYEYDIDRQGLPIAENMIRQPSAWEGLGATHFLTYDDSYGTTSAKLRSRGFPFRRHHLNLDRLLFFKHSTAYLEWLISACLKMRADHPEFFRYKYDAAIDTEATLESQILYGLGKLEANRKYFDRMEIFGPVSGFDRKEIHPIIAKYIFTPRTDVWFSPLSHRYLAMDEAEDKYPQEKLTRDGLVQLYQAVLEDMRSGVGPDKVLLPVALPIQNIPFDTMSFAEDYLMALLERIQFLGFALNTNGDDGSVPSITGIVKGILNPDRRRYLKDETVKYLELFQLEESATDYMYLPGIRRLMARMKGVELPKNETFNIDKRWKTAQAADLTVVTEIAPGGAPVVVEEDESFYEKAYKKRSKGSRRR